MHRFIAVQVQHPRISYAALLRLDRPNRRSRRLVTLSEGQREAIVDVFLLEHRKGEEPRPLRRLHTFHLTNLPARSAGRTQMVLEASYDGRGRAHLAISAGGRSLATTTVAVPREKRRVLWPAAVALLLLLLLGGGWWLLRSLPGFGGGGALPEEPEPVAEAAPPEEPAQPERPAEPQEARPEEPPSLSRESGVGDAPSQPAEEETRVEEETRAAEDTQAGATEGTSERGEIAGAEGSRLVESEPPPEQEYVVYFEPDNTALTPAARRDLAEIAQQLQRRPEAAVRIVGHTALFGTEEGRIEISRGRAENVFQFLRAQGWQPAAEATVAWEGSTDPVTRDRDEQRLNRRVEIEIAGESAQ